jgi:molybdopterin-guanine dinucleotide biosynthesis protein A
MEPGGAATTSPRRCSGIVLAGGAGRRMGAPKAGVVVGGATLVERAVALLSPVCDEVVVVSRPAVALPALAVPVVHDRPGAEGPLNAILTGLMAVGGEDALVLACDMPFAGEAVAALLAAPPGAAVACDGDRPQPLCARYPRRDALRAAASIVGDGGRRAHALIEALPWEPVAVGGRALTTLNTPDDLRAARGG